MGFMNVFSNLFGDSSDSKRSDSSLDLDKYKIDLKLVKLPEEVVMLTNKVVLEEGKSIYSTFRAIDYKINRKRYNDNEWNSWEVSLLLDMYNRNLDFNFSDINEVLSNDVLTISMEDLSTAVKGLVRKYETNVNMENGKLLLQRQKIWSGKEVSIILYYLNKFKKK